MNAKILKAELKFLSKKSWFFMFLTLIFIVYFLSVHFGEVIYKNLQAKTENQFLNSVPLGHPGYFNSIDPGFKLEFENFIDKTVSQIDSSIVVYKVRTGFEELKGSDSLILKYSACEFRGGFLDRLIRDSLNQVKPINRASIEQGYGVVVTQEVFDFIRKGKRTEQYYIDFIRNGVQDRVSLPIAGVVSKLPENLNFVCSRNTFFALRYNEDLEGERSSLHPNREKQYRDFLIKQADLASLKALNVERMSVVEHGTPTYSKDLSLISISNIFLDTARNYYSAQLESYLKQHSMGELKAATYDSDFMVRVPQSEEHYVLYFSDIKQVELVNARLKLHKRFKELQIPENVVEAYQGFGGLKSVSKGVILFTYFGFSGLVVILLYHIFKAHLEASRRGVGVFMAHGVSFFDIESSYLLAISLFILSSLLLGLFLSEILLKMIVDLHIVDANPFLQEYNSIYIQSSYLFSRLWQVLLLIAPIVACWFILVKYFKSKSPSELIK